MTDTAGSAGSSPSSKGPSKTVLITLLCLSLLAIGVVLWLVLAPETSQHEVVEQVVEGPAAEAQGVYKAEIIDAVQNRNVVAVEGRRYKVLIEDESKDSAAGVAKLGGLVTFVDGAKKGDLLVIELTRLKRSTAEGTIIKRLEPEAGIIQPAAPMAIAARPAAAAAPVSADSAVQVGQTYKAVVDDIGKKGDGIAHVGGKVVFVPGVQAGDEATFVIEEDLGNFARARLVSRTEKGSIPVSASPTAAGTASPAVAGRSGPSPADDVQPGKTFDVTVTEKDNKSPDVNGVARIAGLVVFVPGSQPGDHVKIRIIDRGPRFATSEIVEHVEAAPKP